MKSKVFGFLISILFLLVIAAGTTVAEGQVEEGKKSIAVYMPGKLGGGNAMLELSKQGAERAAAETGIDVKIIEGGYDWSAYEPSLKELSASGKYDAIMCFTAGFPGVLQTVMPEFPNQKYILIDAVMDGGDQLYSAQFDSAQMAFLAGAFAAMVTNSDMPHANDQKKIGMTAGMIYPEMTDLLQPGYENGAHMIDPKAEVVFTVTDTWDDPTVGKEIGINMAKSGVDIIFMISNITDMGTIQAGEEEGFYCISVNQNMNAKSPGVVLTGVTKAYDRIVYEVVKDVAEGTIMYGKQETYGIADGMIGYTPADPLFKKHVPQVIQNKMKEIYQQFKDGEIEPLK